jgi:uncharacterized protein YcfJ
MPRQMVISVALGVLSLVAVAASAAKADTIHSNHQLIRSVDVTEHIDLFNLRDVGRGEIHGYLFFVEHWDNGKHLGVSNGKHLGTSKGKHLGISFGLAPQVPQVVQVKSVDKPRATVTQNPEPVSLALLGTGLIALGAAVRHRRKHS